MEVMHLPTMACCLWPFVVFMSVVFWNFQTVQTLLVYVWASLCPNSQWRPWLNVAALDAKANMRPHLIQSWFLDHVVQWWCSFTDACFHMSNPSAFDYAVQFSHYDLWIGLWFSNLTGGKEGTVNTSSKVTIQVLDSVTTSLFICSHLKKIKD